MGISGWLASRRRVFRLGGVRRRQHLNRKFFARLTVTQLEQRRVLAAEVEQVAVAEVAEVASFDSSAVAAAAQTVQSAAGGLQTGAGESMSASAARAGFESYHNSYSAFGEGMEYAHGFIGPNCGCPGGEGGDIAAAFAAFTTSLPNAPNTDNSNSSSSLAAETWEFDPATLEWSVEILIDQSATVFNQSQFQGPRDNRGLAISPDGNFLYAGYNNNEGDEANAGEVRRIDLTTGLTAFDADGNIVPFDAQLKGFRGKAIAVDDVGRVYLAEGVRPGSDPEIAVVRSDLSLDMGQPLFAIDDDGIRPEGIDVVRENGQLFMYTSDRDAGTLTKWEVVEGPGDSILAINKVATFGIYVQAGGDLPLPGAEDLRGVEVGPEGNVWVAGFGNDTIYRVSPDGEIIECAALENPFDIGFNGNQVLVTTHTDRLIHLFTIDDFADDNVITPQSFTAPFTELALDPDGNDESGDFGALSGIVVIPHVGFYVTNELGQTANQMSIYGGGDQQGDDNEPLLFAQLPQVMEPSPPPGPPVQPPAPPVVSPPTSTPTALPTTTVLPPTQLGAPFTPGDPVTALALSDGAIVDGGLFSPLPNVLEPRADRGDFSDFTEDDTSSDLASANEKRYVITEVNPDCTEGEWVRLRDEDIANLQALWKRLPNDYYRIYQVMENGVLRVPIEGQVQDGQLRAADGRNDTQDRPPTTDRPAEESLFERCDPYRHESERIEQTREQLQQEDQLPMSESEGNAQIPEPIPDATSDASVNEETARDAAAARDDDVPEHAALAGALLLAARRRASRRQREQRADQAMARLAQRGWRTN